MKHLKTIFRILLAGMFAMFSLFALADEKAYYNGVNYTISETITDGYRAATLTSITDTTKFMQNGLVVISDDRLDLPESGDAPVYITTIADGAFHTGSSGSDNAWKGAKSIVLNLKYLNYLGNFAFRDITTLTSFSFNTPALATIGKEVFRNCELLTEITIPGSVTTMGNSVFYDCEALTEVTFEKNEAGTALNIGYNTVSSDGSMFKKNSKLTRANIARNFTYSAQPTSGNNKYTPFSDNTHLLEVNFLEGCDSVGSYMFYNNTALVDVTLPEGLTEIKEGAFYGCSAITQLTIPGTVDSIGQNAFYNLTSLKYVDFPYSESNTNGIKIYPQIDSDNNIFGPFKDSPLEIIKIYRAYNYIPLIGLENPTEDQYRQAGLFYYEGVSQISSIELGPKIDEIDHYMFSFGGGSPYNTTLTEIYIPAGIWCIGKEAFRDYVALSEVTIETGLFYKDSTNTDEKGILTRIWHGAFRNCNSLTRFNVPYVHKESVLTIDENVFRDCNNLRYVDLGCGKHLTIAGQTDNYVNYRSPFYNSPLETVRLGCSNLVMYYNEDKIDEPEEGLFYNYLAGKLKSIDLTGFEGEIHDYMFGFGTTMPTNTTLEEVTIPKGVTRIGKYAFKNYAALRDVKFEESDTEVTQIIDEYAFQNCTGLTSFTFAPTVATVKNNAFNGCTALNEVTFEKCDYNDEIYVGYNAADSKSLFYNTQLKQANIARTIRYIDQDSIIFDDKKYSPFADNATLATVNISQGCKELDHVLFGNCGDLTEVNIAGRSLKSIGNSVFRDCRKLNNITLPDSLTTIGAEAFRECNRFTSIIIPGNVTSIGNTAFYGCDSLAEVTFAYNGNNAVINLGYNEHSEITGGLFADCGVLTTVNIGRDITYNSYQPFAGHNVITDVNFLEGATTVADGMFNGSTVLKNVSLAGTIKTIGNDAFSGCTALNGFALNNGLTTIGAAAFKNCSLFTEISIPGTVTSIGNNAFNGCLAVTEVRFEPSTATPASVIEVGYDAEYNQSLFQGLTNLVEISVARDIKLDAEDNLSNAPFANSKAKTATFEVGCTTIPRGFMFNSTALSSVYFQNGSVVTIGDHAFRDCTTLATVELGDTLKTIKNDAFRNCEALKELHIPGSVTSIEQNVFYDVNNLHLVDFASGTEPLTIARQYKKKEDSETYNYYGTFYDSPLDTIYFDRPLAAYTVESEDDGLFYYNGQGKIAHIELGNNVNRIPDYAFYFKVDENKRYNTTLTKVVIPDSVTSIGIGAFRDYTALTDVTLSNNLDTIGDDAFRNCLSLPSIVIPDSVKSIGANAFMHCSNLNYIYALPVIPPGIVESTFYGRYNVATLYYSDEAYTTADYWKDFINKAKINSKGVQFVVDGIQYEITHVNNSVKVVKNTATAYSGEIFIPETVVNPFDETISYKVTGLDVNAFKGNTAVIRVHLPDNIVNTANAIPDLSFNGCTALARIYLSFATGSTFRSISETTFDENTYNNAWVYVPENMIQTFRSIEHWSKFKNVTHYDGVGFDFEKEGFMYRVTAERSKVSVVPNDEYDRATGVAAIPATVVNPYTQTPFKVTAIADKALYDYDELTALTIGGNVATIGYTAFHGCDKLASIVFDPALEDVSNTLYLGYDKKGSYSAFKHCKKLANVTLNRTLMPMIADQNELMESDFKYAAFGDNPYIEQVTVGAGCDAFCSFMFRDCRNLAAITFNEGATLATIGIQAFYNCESLSAIVIPGSVTLIGNSTFHDCDRLASVTFEKNPDNVAILMGYNDKNTGSMFKHNSKLNNVVIARTLSPSETPTDDNYKYVAAFGDNQNVKSVTFRDGVVEIPAYYFRNCKNLATVTFEGVTSLTTIGEQSFRDCIRLAGAVALPEGVATVGNEAFRNCEKITEITIPGTATKVGYTAFHDCSILATVTFAYNETANSGDLQLGYNKVNNGSAFKNTGKLRTVNLARSIVPMSEDVSKLGDNDFKYAPFGDNSHITTVNILKGCTALPAYMFRDCDNLATVTVAGDNTFTGAIGVQAFRNCKKVKTINFTQAGSVGSAAFRDCTGLITLTLGDRVTAIGNEAFRNCKALTAITFPATVTQIDENAFYGMTGLKKVTFEDGEADLTIARQMKSGNYYGAFYDSPLDTIYFNRPLSGYTIESEDDGLFYYKNQGKIKSLSLGNNVKEIHDYMFSFDRSGNRNTTLTTVMIPGSVTKLGKYAFRDYTALASVTLNDGLTTISEDAFRNCESLAAITIPSTVTNIAQNAFYDAKGLKSVEFEGAETCEPLMINRMKKGDSYYGAFYDSPLETVKLNRNINSSAYKVESEDDGLFYRNGDGQIGTVEIGNYVDSIGDYMFYSKNYNKKLLEVNIPARVKMIGKGAFRDCVKLSSVTIENGNVEGVVIDKLEVIKDEAFRNCKALTAITFPTTLESIGENAFKDCKNLATITTYAKTPPTIVEATFDSENYANTKVVVRPDAHAFYTQHTVWKKFFISVGGYPTNVEDVIEESSLRIYGYNGNVIVSGAEVGDVIAIYDIAGTMHHLSQANSSEERIAMHTRGIYIVRVGNRVVKVVI